MAKDTYYFSHDFGARNDPKIQNVLMEMGCEGVGIFWCIVESIYEQGGTLPLKSCKSIAFALHVDVKKVESVVNDFELFKSDGVSFWSESINLRLNKKNELIKKRKNAAAKRWNNENDMQNDASALNNDASALNNDASALDSDASAMQLNKIKEKEIKENYSIINLSKSIGKELMTDEEKQLRFDTLKTELTNWSSWHESLCIATKRNRINVLSLINDFLNNLKADDDYYKDLTEIKKHCRNWINKQEKTNVNTNQPSIPAI